MTNCASCGFYAKTRRWRDGLGRIHSVCNLCFSTEAAPLLLTPSRPPFGNTDTETIGVLMRGLNEILRALRANRRLQPTTDALPPRCMNDHSQNNTSKKKQGKTVAWVDEQEGK